MIDWVNIVLRTLMCLAFLVLVLRPMMMALVRRETNQEALEELANSAVNSAFAAWGQNAKTPAYYQNPELALLALQHPEVLQLSDKPPVQVTAPAEPTSPSDVPSGAPVSSAGPTPAGTPVVQTGSPAASGSQAQPSASATVEEPVVPDEAVDPDEQLQQMRDRIKKEQKKAKPSIPTELLNNANSYEDKLMVVRMIVDQERDRVAATLKRMIQVE